MRRHADSREAMSKWLGSALKADWKNIADVRREWPNTNAVPMKSGRTATITNVGGNSYRLALSIDYRYAMVYVRRVMTHAEYNKNSWHADF